MFIKKNKNICLLSITIINFLLKNNVIHDAYKYTPLMSSIYASNHDYINYFLKNGKYSIDDISTNGDTCLSIAISMCDINTVMLLLSYAPNRETIIHTFNAIKYINLGRNRRIVIMKKLIKYTYLLDPDICLMFDNILINFKSFMSIFNKEIVMMKNTAVCKTTVFNLIFNRNDTMNLHHIYNPDIIKFKYSTIYGNKVKKVMKNSIMLHNAISFILEILENEPNTYWSILPMEIKFKILNFLHINKIHSDFFYNEK
ncbi:ankyrin repeat protein B4 [BeAn 58058 virus]|uniref:ankyrin repeat protein B4 n=1 Tax=BeAn 58058 virus TaxID=67082 RepID=UPI00090AFD2A|nr:ankyrin repeat protein B4 [BeAn 58058 virus]APG58367.1 ankyrin repeat protein B4 [BeAn 58058 virus]